MLFIIQPATDPGALCCKAMGALYSRAMGLLYSTAMGMLHPKQLASPNMSEAFMESADVLLVLDDGTAVPCHSHILSMHSAVLCNMLKDLARQHDEKVIRIPLEDFTEAQCSALLSYLYDNSLSCKGAAFAEHSAAACDAAAVVARFAHTYDAPHALRHVEAFMAAFLDAHYTSKAAKPGAMFTWRSAFTWQDTLDWAVMADKFDMRELRGHCERAMVLHWKSFSRSPGLVDQLSRSALQRITKGLNAMLVAEREARGTQGHKYPPVRDFIAWGKQ